jgi:hypothetical protein
VSRKLTSHVFDALKKVWWPKKGLEPEVFVTSSFDSSLQKEMKQHFFDSSLQKEIIS